MGAAVTPDDLTRERPFLFGLAYRMLGSAADAEDVLQEAWLRVAEVDDARSPRALLATVVTRLCLDETRSARRRRETYVGPWLPEPLAGAVIDDDRLEQAESMSTAFLVLLESLSPAERAVFVLREVLDFDFADVAAAVGRTEAACRQLRHRAKERVAERPARYAPPPDERAARTAAFVAAMAMGDVEALVRMMSDDASAVTDHGGKASAIRRVIEGADPVARLLTGLARKSTGVEGVAARLAEVNGAPALVIREGDRVTSVIQFGWSDGADGPRVSAVYMTRNPDKLRAVDEALRDGW